MRPTPCAPVMMHWSSLRRIAASASLSLIACQYFFSNASNSCSTALVAMWVSWSRKLDDFRERDDDTAPCGLCGRKLARFTQNIRLASSRLGRHRPSFSTPVITTELAKIRAHASEQILRSNLNLARRGDSGGDASPVRRGVAGGIGERDPPRRHREIGPIQHVERLETNLHRLPRTQPDGLDQRHVSIEEPGADERVPPEIAAGVRRGQRERVD